MPRPKGSKNKRTVGIPGELRDALGHRDPALVLAEVYSMDQVALAKLVRSAAGARAVAFRVQAAVAAMPYVHSKMPVAVTVEDVSLPTLVIDAINHQMVENKRFLPSTARAVSPDVVSLISQDIEGKGKSDE